MNALKYSRLPTSDPGPEFSALDGPSYFSYEIERKKYGSAFNYTGTAVDTETIHPVGKLIGVTFVQYDTSVQLSTFADNVALPAFGRRTPPLCAVLLQRLCCSIMQPPLSMDISCLPGPQQQTRRSCVRRRIGQTDRQMDGHRTVT